METAPNRVVAHSPEPNRPYQGLVEWRAALQSIEWRAVVGYETLYEVSEYGDVRRTHDNSLVKPSPDGKDRLFVLLRKENERRYWKSHRLVAFAFLGFPQVIDYEVCHNDGNHRNNHFTNLRWDSHSANMLDAVAHGTHTNSSKTHCPRGHEYNSANTYSSPAGDRRCKRCRQITRAANRARELELQRIRRSISGQNPGRRATA